MAGLLRERKCDGCGSAFTYSVGRGKDRKYCKEECRPPAPAPKSRCSVDGCGVRARSDSSLYCERHYYRLRRTGRLTLASPQPQYRNCAYCGTATVGKKYCDSRCAARYARNVPLRRPCVVCGIEFDTLLLKERSVTCSIACRRKRTRQISLDCYQRKMQTEDGKAKVRRADYTRKARKAKAHVEDVDWLTVMERGGWQCHICNGPIPKDAVWPAQEFGTVDHVVPLARGGEHSYANCKPAHLTCNCRKGAKFHVEYGE